MRDLKVTLDRYDGRSVVERIKPESLKYKGDDALIPCSFGEDEEFEIHFEAKSESVDHFVLEVAKRLMLSVHELDNRIQESCAAECKRSGLHPRNFESMLTYVRVYPDYALLHNFSTGVNTEWEEKASFDGSGWTYLGIQSPNAQA